MAALQGVTFDTDRHADVARFSHKGRSFVLIKPSTFMNLSGKAVAHWMKQEKITPDHILVVVDDLALDLGVLRMRGQGSDGGHNGLKSITETLATQSYARLRIGIGNNFPKGRQSDYVLGPWTGDEMPLVIEAMNKGAMAALDFGLMGVTEAMNRHNG